MSLIIPGNIVAFLTGAWGKIAMYGILIGVLLFGFRIWLNRHDDRIFQDGKNRAVETMAKDYESRLKVGMAEAKAMSDTAAEDRAAVEAQISELDARFALIFGSLREIKVLAEKRQVVYVEKISTIPPSQLDASLRAISNDPAIRPAH
jgi:hypothetical protein